VTFAAAGVFALPAGLVQEMYALDRAYIPALGLTGQPDQFAKAKTAFATFESTWFAFRDGVAAQGGFDQEWKGDLAKIDRIVAEAKKDLLVDSNAPAAHAVLEGVRMTFLAARERLDVPYFIDYLTLYHNAMESLLNGIPAKPLAELNGAEKLSIASDLDLAIAHWNKAKAMEGLLAPAGLSPQPSSTYAAQWEILASAMKGARKALDAGDDKALAAALGQLKPNFIKAFFLFGNFGK
jgi:hypothetical protein